MTVWGKGPYTSKEVAIRRIMKFAGLTPSTFEIEDEAEVSRILYSYARAASAREGEALARVRAKVEIEIKNVEKRGLASSFELLNSYEARCYLIGLKFALAEIDAATKDKESE